MKTDIDDQLRVATARVSELLQDAQPHPPPWHHAFEAFAHALRDRPEHLTDAQRLEHFERALSVFESSLQAQTAELGIQ